MTKLHLAAKSVAFGALVATTAMGCSSSSSGGAAAADDGIAKLPNLPAIDKPEGGLKLYTPIMTIEPGEDATFCTFVDYIMPEDTIIHTTGGTQTPFGHHALLYYAPVPQKPGTARCDGVDMASFRQTLGGTGGEGGLFWQPPDNVGTRIPKHSQYVIQTHWINTTAQQQQVQASMITLPMKVTSDTIIAGTVAIVNAAFSVDPHQTKNETTNCTFDTDHKLLIAAPHEHEWGTHVKAEIHRMNGTVDPILDVAFKPEYMSHPPFNDYGVLKPLMVSKGDTIRLDCEWNNTTEKRLEFPTEMCVLFSFSMEDDDAHCTNGGWDHTIMDTGPTPDGGTSLGCVPMDAKGNDKGVGEFCSKGGGQCTDNGSGNATFCAADFDTDPNSTSTFCTKPCVDETSCGPGVLCVGDTPTSTTKGCVPASCGPSWALDGGM